MDEVKDFLTQILQQNYTQEDYAGSNEEDIVENAYSTLESILPEEYTEEEFSQAAGTAVFCAMELNNSSELDESLYEAMYSAEDELGFLFTAEEVDQLHEMFSQSEFAEGSDPSQEAYSLVYDFLMDREQEQEEYALKGREKRRIRREMRGALEEMGVIAPAPFSIHRLLPRSKQMKAWDTASDIMRSPLMRTVSGLALQRGQMVAANGMRRVMAANGNPVMFSDALSEQVFSTDEAKVAAQTRADMARQEKEDIQNTPTAVSQLGVLEELVALPQNPIKEAKDHIEVSRNTDFTKEVANMVKAHDEHGKEQQKFSEEILPNQDEYASWFRRTKKSDYDNAPELLGMTDPGETGRRRYSPGSVGDIDGGMTKETIKGGRFYGGSDTAVGTLGIGQEYRAWRARLPRNERGGIAFNVGMLTGAMTDAIAEGMLAGTYYQSLDTGFKMTSGTIKSGVKGLEALMKPTFDKAQERLERSGNKFASWLMPDTTTTELLGDLSDKDAGEAIKIMDQVNTLNKLPESTRTLLLINISQSGCCYLDEKGTLARRKIVERMLNTYKRNSDEFFEYLPQELDAVKELYSKSSLLSKDSINTEAVMSRLKGAKSEEQVRQILTEELNVIKKPLTSLQDLSTAIANDFITFQKTDRRQYIATINKIARDVETMRRKGTSNTTLLDIATIFLRELSAARNEVEIKRATEKLVLMNLKYVMELASLATNNFAEEELEIEGGNVNMENSPVKSTGNRTNIVPGNLSHTAGWNDAEIKEADENNSTDAMGDTIDKAKGQSNFSMESNNEPHIDFFSGQSFSSSQACEQVSAPGFGVSAYMS